MGCTDSQTFRLSLRPEVMQPLIGRQQGWRRRDNVVVHEAATGQPLRVNQLHENAAGIDTGIGLCYSPK